MSEGLKTILIQKCGDCQLSLFDGCSSAEDIFDIYKTVEKWSKEHKEGK